MSHDIRTPLNGIIGMVNMGNQYADDPQMQQKIREKVMESLKYLLSLVNDVLDMNKLQSLSLIHIYLYQRSDSKHEYRHRMYSGVCILLCPQ